jgi:SnoaL-like domain
MTLMTEPISTLIHRYVELWNEHDPIRRQAAAGDLLTENSRYTDPDWAAVVGSEAIAAMIGEAQQKLGDLRFTVATIINTHHDLALFAWHLGPADGTPPVATGYDAVQFERGKVCQVYGFFV